MNIQKYELFWCENQAIPGVDPRKLEDLSDDVFIVDGHLVQTWASQ